MAETRFSEEQTARILRQAAELQSGTAPETPDGLSETELKTAAAEMGIEPAYLEAAIAREAVEKDQKPGIWGGPLSGTTELAFPGTLTDDAWEETLADLRQTFGEDGTATQRGLTREWTAGGGNVSPVGFTVRQVEGTVRVTATFRLDSLIVIYGLAAIIPLILGFVAMEKGMGLPAPAENVIRFLYFVAILLGVRWYSGRTAQGQARLVREAAHRIQTRLQPQSAERIPSEIQNPKLKI